MTIAEIEAACDRAHPLDFSRHALEAPELALRGDFYPIGFAAEVRTNCEEVLTEAGRAWCTFRKRFQSTPISIDIHVIESESTECPPSPTYGIMQPMLVSFADAQNYCIIDLARNTTQIMVSTAALRHKLYFRYFFLESAAASHIATRFATPVHAACVALEGNGVLLCGDSGAGKSTLAYACARAGWQYISDDATYILNRHQGRAAIGNCYQVRLRPSAAKLFPEIAEFGITPRAAGKPSIELPTSSISQIERAESTDVKAIVFLNRHSGGEPQLLPYRKEVARQFMRQVLFGPAESLAIQYNSIERLLSADVFELRYADLEWAMERLRKLVREGC